MRSQFVGSLLVGACISLGASQTAHAQPLGTFRWQLQPYCNVVTVNVTGIAGVYTLEGYDDQCGAPNRAPLTGVATPNPDGTIGFGLHVVTAPGGRGVQIDARISLAALSGPWTDSDGYGGTFAFGKSTGGSPRPRPVSTPVIPATFNLRSDGGFLAGGSLGTGAIPESGPGTRMMWYPARGAFRAGTVGTEWDDSQVGGASAAFGWKTRAAGPYSFAAGIATAALGRSATAFGDGSEASGESSLAVGASARAAGTASAAFGSRANATGTASLAAGQDVTANGIGSVAIGANALASGSTSVALGFNVAAVGTAAVALGSDARSEIGSFTFADRSVSAVFASGPNQFNVRSVGGAGFYTKTNLTAGVELKPGASAWSSVSDVNLKENFRDLDGAEVLAKLVRMPIQEWNYKAQDASIRHAGPTAQDFHEAFGLGEDPLRISTIDADGIALAAVRALALENQTLRAELDALRARVDALDIHPR